MNALPRVGYYLPPNHKNLPKYDGFYIENTAVYQSGSSDTLVEWGWNRLQKSICHGMRCVFPELEVVGKWLPVPGDRRRYVLLRNSHIDVTLETEDTYTAVFVIIPEHCENPMLARAYFNGYTKQLEKTLKSLYPGNISKRINARERYFLT